MSRRKKRLLVTKDAFYQRLEGAHALVKRKLPASQRYDQTQRRDTESWREMQDASADRKNLEYEKFDKLADKDDIPEILWESKVTSSADAENRLSLWKE